VIGFSEALAEETRPHGVKVLVILPGPVDTAMWCGSKTNHCSPPEILPPERVSDLIIFMITLPADTILLSPSIVALKKPRHSLKT
jgi:3-oxoacyl-[acyl-carrier protein] reductase